MATQSKDSSWPKMADETTVVATDGADLSTDGADLSTDNFSTDDEQPETPAVATDNFGGKLPTGENVHQ
jgi:hypothetical protein